MFFFFNVVQNWVLALQKQPGGPDPYTVCPGSSDPPEKILNTFASENEVYTIF